MAQGRAWGRVSALLSIVGGAVLLLLVLAEAKPPAEPVTPPTKVEQAEPEPPQETKDQAAEPVNLAAVMLPAAADAGSRGAGAGGEAGPEA